MPTTSSGATRTRHPPGADPPRGRGSWISASDRRRQPELREERWSERRDLADLPVDDAEHVELERAEDRIAGGAEVAGARRQAIGGGRQQPPLALAKGIREQRRDDLEPLEQHRG